MKTWFHAKYTLGTNSPAVHVVGGARMACAAAGAGGFRLTKVYAVLGSIVNLTPFLDTA